MIKIIRIILLFPLATIDIFARLIFAFIDWDDTVLCEKWLGDRIFDKKN